MAGLNLRGKAGEFDQTYNELVEAFEGLNDEESLKLSAALIVVLANHIGDEQAVRDAIAIAKGAVDDRSQDS